MKMQDDKFKLEKRLVNGKEEYKLEGTIDEDTELGLLTSSAGPIYLNLSGVKSINSLGIRGWVNFWKEHSNKEVFYLECPPIIVRQMTMIPSFTGRAQVVSVYVPYVCENCDAEKLVLVELSHHTVPEIQDSFPCSKCGQSQMELDANPKQYFSFNK